MHVDAAENETINKVCAGFLGAKWDRSRRDAIQITSDLLCNIQVYICGNLRLLSDSLLVTVARII